MSRETESVIKKKQINSKKESKMNFFEFIIHRFDFLVVNTGRFIHRNIYLLLSLAVIFIFVAYLHQATYIFEKLWAAYEGKIFVISQPEKNVTMWKFLGL